MGSSLSKIYDNIREHGSVEEYLKSLDTNLKHIRAMNFRTFSVTENNIEVCVHRDRNDEGEDFVLITAFIPDSDGTEEFLEEEVSFDSINLLTRFIDDFSIASAEAFVKVRVPL